MNTMNITELELEVGLWRPDAAVICVDCHVKQMGDRYGFGSDKPMDDDRKTPVPLKTDSWEDIGICDECGKEIWMDCKIVFEQRIVKALKEKGYKAAMEQTGGMCSAAGLPLGWDERGGDLHMWITWDEDTRDGIKEPRFLIGWYRYTNGGNDDEEEYIEKSLTFDEAVAVAVTTYEKGWEWAAKDYS